MSQRLHLVVSSAIFRSLTFCKLLLLPAISSLFHLPSFPFQASSSFFSSFTLFLSQFLVMVLSLKTDRCRFERRSFPLKGKSLHVVEQMLVPFLWISEESLKICVTLIAESSKQFGSFQLLFWLIQSFWLDAMLVDLLTNKEQTENKKKNLSSCPTTCAIFSHLKNIKNPGKQTKSNLGQ